MAKNDRTTTLDRAKTALRGVSGRQAAVAGAGVLGGIAVGAALFANWRRVRTSAEPHVEAEPVLLDLVVIEAETAAVEGNVGKLHAMGTPMTMPVDGGVQSYTGDRAPDMSVDYTPGVDQGEGSAPRDPALL